MPAVFCFIMPVRDIYVDAHFAEWHPVCDHHPCLTRAVESWRRMFVSQTRLPGSSAQWGGHFACCCVACDWGARSCVLLCLCFSHDLMKRDVGLSCLRHWSSPGVEGRQCRGQSAALELPGRRGETALGRSLSCDVGHVVLRPS